jgi:hypothetical protein
LSEPTDEARQIDADVKTLHGMGYAQELLRRMSGFSNFAISLSWARFSARESTQHGNSLAGQAVSVLRANHHRFAA